MRPVTVKELLACRTRLGIAQVAGPAGSTAAVTRVFSYPARENGWSAGTMPSQAIVLFPPGEAWRDFLSGGACPISPPFRNVPCMAVSAREIPGDLRSYSESSGTPLFASLHDPFLLHSRLTGLLRELGERTVMVHGVLVRLSGRGVLIMGESGIGKTSTGLALMHSEHRWVADDAVILEGKRDTLYGRGHERSRGWIAVRGRGILRAEELLGPKRLLGRSRVDVIIRLTAAAGHSGNSAAPVSWVGVTIPCRDLTTDIDPGRTADRLLDCLNRLDEGKGHE
ncbi:MAG: hypothetical protein LLG97_22055 [Deltaproteobacteria bacterium]|nr:hypothetical protein [Deltaproteobacteria bacterium]